MTVDQCIHTFVCLSLQVIKKVMKMDAAEPFNAPVNAEALGIPVSVIGWHDALGIFLPQFLIIFLSINNFHIESSF